MISTDKYEQYRQAVIDLFNRYIENRESLYQSVGEKGSLDNKDLEILTNEVKKIKDNKYLLAIVGESKSGKSMFINALLKKPVLPTGILQCTSGIIEIIDTDTPQENQRVYLKVKYASKPEETQIIYEDASETEPIQKKLGEIAAISEEYRALPTSLLNQYLIDYTPQNITDRELDRALEDIDLDDPQNNPHRLSKEQFKSRVKQYLIDYKDLTKIPSEIIVGYPLGFKFTQMRLVDTPGVNALGRVQDLTLKYVNAANAAIFIHMLKNNIASQSYRDFFNKVPIQAQKNIFMFLTHKAISTQEDVEITLDEAKNLYSKRESESEKDENMTAINGERIIAIDSMLKQIYNELESGMSLEEFKKNEERKKLISPYIVDYGDDLLKIKQAILEDSNFTMAENLLREFSEKALAGQLKYVIEELKKAYQEQSKIYADAVKLRSDKIEKSPEEFEREINALIKLLAEYKVSLNQFSISQRKRYTGLKSDVAKDFSKLKGDYIMRVMNSNDERVVRKHIADFNNDCESQITYFTNQLSNEYEAEMERLSIEFQSKHNISLPKISINEISTKAKTLAYETITIPGDRIKRVATGSVAGGILGAIGGFFVAGPVGAVIGGVAGAAGGGSTEYFESTPDRTEQKYSAEKYLNAYIGEANELIGNIADQMQEATTELFNTYDKDFREKLSIRIKERQKVYEDLKEKKAETEKLLDEIETIKIQKKVVDDELKNAKTAMKNLS